MALSDLTAPGSLPYWLFSSTQTHSVLVVSLSYPRPYLPEQACHADQSLLTLARCISYHSYID